MKNKIYLFFLLTFLLFTLTGCYDASSIEDSYYVIAMGIDLAENDLYSISIQIAKNSSDTESSSNQSSSYIIYTVEAETVESGITILNNYLNKKINLSHCSALVFSEELAKQGLGNLINSLANNDEIRPTSYILISSSTAYDVLDKVSNSGEKFSSRFYEYIINSVHYTGYSVKITFDEFLSNINNSSNDSISIYTMVNDDSIQNNGIAIFKDDHMVGKVSSSETIAHLLLMNKLEESLISIPNPFDSSTKMDLAIGIEKNCNKKVEIINNTPFISCEIFLSATIKTSGEHFDYTTTENIELIELCTSQYLENIILNYLYALSKEYNSDILDFQNILSQQCLTIEELESYHWKDIYQDSFFQVNINTSINSTHLYDKE